MTKPLAIGCLQGLLALLILGGVWGLLPARWPWLDVPGSALGLACAVAAFGLCTPTPWAVRVARVVLWAELISGSLLVTLLGASMAQLAGAYGPVGAGGAVLFGVIALLVLPYLVVFPALQLRWLRERG